MHDFLFKVVFCLENLYDKNLYSDYMSGGMIHFQISYDKGGGLRADIICEARDDVCLR